MSKKYWNVSDEIAYLKRAERRTNAADLVRQRKALSGQVASHGRGLSLQQQAQSILLEIRRIDKKIESIWRNPLGREKRLAKLQKRKSRLIERFKEIVFEITNRGEALSGDWLIRKRIEEEYREGY